MNISISKIQPIQSNQIKESSDKLTSSNNNFLSIFSELLNSITSESDNNLSENLYSIEDFLSSINKESLDDNEITNNQLQYFINFCHLNLQNEKQNLLNTFSINNNNEIIYFDLIAKKFNEINSENIFSDNLVQSDFYDNIEKSINIKEFRSMINNIVNKLENNQNAMVLDKGISDFLNPIIQTPINEQFDIQNKENDEFNRSTINTKSLENDSLSKLDDVVSKLNKINFSGISLNEFKIPIEQKETFIFNPQQIIKITLNKVKDAINKNITELKIHLRPKELGDVLIKLTYNEGLIEGKIVANKTVTEILQTNFDTLKNDIKNSLNHIKDFNLELMNEDNNQNYGSNHNQNNSNKGKKRNKNFENYFKDIEE